MLHPVRISTYPTVGFYRSGISSKTGLPRYNPAVYMYPYPGYQTGLAAIDSVDDDRKSGLMHPVIHYKRMFTGENSLTVFPMNYVNGYNDASGHWMGETWCRLGAWDYLNQYSSDSANTPIGRYGSWANPINGFSPLAVVDVPGKRITPISISDLQSLVTKALQSLMPGIKPSSNVSLLNSLFELKDVKSLPRTLFNFKTLLLNHKMVRLAKNSYSTNASLKQVARSIFWRQFARTASDVYLQQQFNIMPLISDIVGVNAAMSEVRAKLKKLCDDAGKPLKKHYVSSDLGFRGSSTHYTGTLSSVFVNRSYALSRQVSYPTQKFCLTLAYKYDLPGSVDELSTLRGFMDMVGVNLNPAIIWNAIPWSFTVDWLFGIGRWLDQWKIRWIEPKIYIRDVIYSVKVQRSIDAHCVHADMGDVGSGVVEVLYYRSKPTSLYKKLEASGLSLKELSLSAALLGSR